MHVKQLLTCHSRPNHTITNNTQLQTLYFTSCWLTVAALQSKANLSIVQQQYNQLIIKHTVFLNIRHHSSNVHPSVIVTAYIFETISRTIFIKNPFVSSNDNNTTLRHLKHGRTINIETSRDSIYHQELRHPSKKRDNNTLLKANVEQNVERKHVVTL